MNSVIDIATETWPLREECLNAIWFTSLGDARHKIETWR
jgi:hypothetical protein